MIHVISDSPILAAVWAHWCSKRDGNHAPSRKRIDPGKIIRCLPNVQFVTRDPDGEFRYGLTGGAIIDGDGYNPSTKRFAEVMEEPRLGIERRQFERVWTSGCPSLSRNKRETVKGAAKIVTRIIMPLSEDRHSVSAVFVAQLYEYSGEFFAKRGAPWEIDQVLDESELVDASAACVAPQAVAAIEAAILDPDGRQRLRNPLRMRW